MHMPIKSTPLNIILLGDPAAGKATQAQRLLKSFPLYDLDMGKELRLLKAKNAKVRKLLEGTYDKGNLTQTDLVRGIHKQKVLATPKSKGILFDGTPKMLGEAKLVAKWLKAEKRSTPMVIYLTIPMDETVRRMTERKQDFRGKFGKRSDDNAQALKERVKYYRTNITEVVKFFRKIYKFKKISSDAPVPQVQKILVGLLNNFKNGKQ